MEAIEHQDPFFADDLSVRATSSALGDDGDVGGGEGAGLLRVGAPLPGLTEDELARFEAGAEAFAEVEVAEEGLGPIYNGNSCGACHDQPALGGGANFVESRFGLLLADGTFDSLQDLGGNLQQFFAIGSHATPPGCVFPNEIIPPQANVRTLRRSNPLFGFGLIDNVPDDELRLLAAIEQRINPATAGHVAVSISIATQQPVVSKFGWKAQVPSLFEFSGKAYVDEMGITTPQFPLENCPNEAPDCELVQACDPVPGIDDPELDDVQAFTDFMAFLAPLPRGPVTDSVKRGQAVFAKTGCVHCHTPTLVTGPSEVAALDRKTFHPYSDFLLHDFAAAGDGIGPDQGNASEVVVNATPTEMRTAPLWGVRELSRYLHDGRARTVAEAILEHDGQGAAARDRYRALSGHARADLLAFVNSL